ncbi:unnamed protein product [Ceutorhynchus assimilis]|uniref:Uncharacterized protein n=1 Tax=Ceutorhynchus assimilis TaxID=467358 RepID=A0A9N9MPF8_9CUCU|nr:unnamed protein product [Ceutorhynchus assimilis]
MAVDLDIHLSIMVIILWSKGDLCCTNFDIESGDSFNDYSNIPAEETTCQPSTSQTTSIVSIDDNGNERGCSQIQNNESQTSQNDNESDSEEETCQSGVSKEVTESEKILELCNESSAELDKTFDCYQDLALWPDCINNDVIKFCLDFPYFQNYDHNNRYPKSEITCEKHKRHFSNSCFSKTLKNGQQIKRQWLCNSPSSGLIYCITCKLFLKVESKLKTGLNDWSNILRLLDMHQEKRFNKVSTKLQSSGLDIQEGGRLLDSLKKKFQDTRKKSESETDKLEANAKELSEDIEKEFAESSKRKRKILLANKETEMPMFTGKAKFRVEIINRLLDFLIGDLHRRSSVYQDLTVKFKCLFDIGDISHDDIDAESFKILIEYYSEDLEEELISKALQFKQYNI